MPLCEAEFSGLMARFEPFEPAPRLAVAVSGGADSLALTLLLHDWARGHGGAVVGLTVDHGLRPEAEAEASSVARCLAAQGIEHHILQWRGPKPRSNVQATARRARYGLLEDWCARNGVLYLGLGHHRDDQAETWLLRLDRGSGLDGLAAMAPVSELPNVQLLRPLLTVPKGRLEATLAARGLSWIEDPTNRDRAYTRVRLRQVMPTLAAEGLTPARIADAAGYLASARAVLDQGVARLLAEAARVDPAGFAELTPGPLATAPREVAIRALARVLVTVGGLEYPPRLERLQRLYEKIHGGFDRGATLGGCRIIPRRGRLLIAREPGKTMELTVCVGQRLHWDGRFAIAISRQTQGQDQGRDDGVQDGELTLSALGSVGWVELRAAAPTLRNNPIPAPARLALPVLRDAAGVIAAPQLGYNRANNTKLTIMHSRFFPKIPLCASAFTVA